MATRLYTSALMGQSVNPTSFSAGWNATSPAAEKFVKLQKRRVDTSEFITFAGVGDGTNANFTCLGRLVSRALTTQTIDGTVKGQFLCLRTTQSDTLAVAIKVVKPDGTDRGVLLAVSASDNTGAEPPRMATGLTNRQIQDVSENTSITLSSVSATAGDFIVVELGFRQGGTSTTSTVNIRASSNTTDLGENNSDTSGACWLEFSDDITFIDNDEVNHSSKSVPFDLSTATNTLDPTDITPPFGIESGDLVLMIGQQRAASVTLAVSNAGGQTWTTEAAISTTNQTARLFWCVFNGTWSANPSVDFSATTCNSVQMHVFRPTAADYIWAVNVAQVELDIAAAATQTITGQTTTGSDTTITIAGWFTADDNTWGTLSGTDWNVLGDAQYRNTSGTDQSANYAYKIQTSAAATGNVSKTQLTNGNDAATTFIITFSMAQPITLFAQSIM